jgi:oligopeptide/dipeptide ABC transporter ATP-binding protein
MSAAEPLLRVTDLSVRFPGAAVPAVQGVDIEVPKGGSVGLVGESGSGKSMTALAVLGLTPENASVRAERLEFEGRDLNALSTKERRRLRGARIGYVPQDPLSALNPVLNVGDQITEVERMHPAGGRPHRVREVLRGFGVGSRSSTTVRRASELLESVSIAEPRARAVQYPHQFSGGMRQRAIIASALSQAPSLVIADEPTTALDATVEKQVLDMLSELRAERGVAMLLVSHDLNVVSWHCDHVYVLYGGRLLEEARAERLFSEPRQPYTAALLAATPAMDRPPRARVRKSSAEAVGPRSRGCPFAARCPRALPVCSERFPDVTAPAPDHRFWCHNPL